MGIRDWFRFAEPAAPKKPTMAEVAGSTGDGRDITLGTVAADTPRVPTDSILTSKGAGEFEFYRAVLADWQVFSALQQRRMALLGCETEVLPGGESPADIEAAEWLEAQLAAVQWDQVCDLMHYGVFYGFAVAEMMWGTDGQYVTIDAIKVRDRTRFLFDVAGNLRLRTSANSDGELLPPNKMWNFRCGADYGDEPYGMGLAHWCYWPVFFKKNGIKFWLVASEKWASPTVWGQFPPGTDLVERNKLLAALRAIQTDSGIITPETMKIELLEASKAGTTDYAALCGYMDQSISKIIVGQVMTLEAVGGQYKAEVQNQVRQELIKADADLICESFNKGPVKWLTAWNFPNAMPPKVWRRTEIPEDLGKRSEWERRVFDMGFRPTLQQIQDTYDGEWELASQPAAAGQESASGASDVGEQPPEFAEAAPGPAQANIDRIAAAAAAASPDLPIRLIDLRRAVLAATDQADLERRLAALVPKDSTDWAEALRAAQVAAAVIGYVAAEENQV